MQIFKAFKPSGYLICHKIQHSYLCIMSTDSIYVFCMILRTKSDYFPVQH